jgi:hypothetical protein
LPRGLQLSGGGICNSKLTEFPDNCNPMRVRRAIKVSFVSASYYGVEYLKRLEVDFFAEKRKGVITVFLRNSIISI